MNSGFSTYHKQDEHRKTTRAGGATACATAYRTVEAEEQMGCNSFYGLWSHVTYFSALPPKKQRAVKDSRVLLELTPAAEAV